MANLILNGNQPQCSEHPQAFIIEDARTSESICSACGLVLSRLVDNCAEWRNDVHAGVAGASRVGGPINPMLYGTDLGTAVLESDGTISETCESGSAGLDNDLIHGIDLIRKLGASLGVDLNNCNSAINIFKEVHCRRKELFNKPSMNSIAAASLYVACRQSGTFLLYKQLCKKDRVRKLDISKQYRVICKVLGLQLPPAKAEDYIPSLCSLLALGEDVKRTAMVISKSAVRTDLVTGRNPVAVAAAAIYFVCQASKTEDKRTRNEIAQVAEVSPLTLSVVYKQMYPHAEELFPPEFKFTTPIEELPLN